MEHIYGKRLQPLNLLRFILAIPFMVLIGIIGIVCIVFVACIETLPWLFVENSCWEVSRSMCKEIWEFLCPSYEVFKTVRIK